MTASVIAPPELSAGAIRVLVVDRVDNRRLSVGMVAGIAAADNHGLVAHGFVAHRFVADGSSAMAAATPATEGLVNETTVFEIGSITKLFTAPLPFDPANRGEVRLDGPVAQPLPRGKPGSRLAMAEPCRCAIWPRIISQGRMPAPQDQGG